ncbi:hypothetical protein SISNIDRAFT_459089 [Sistotremastrum niveocremeum HHB9708]|uniref:Uncharacterized protein n=1 Tax=Sistotremastrum niveocremeum HHB9708 TaxID=1314777 RepID=A0A164PWZ4_9AGAM|nr:hypothetical protein SISNIDRAFT_459089 [Sistotremastrum niveocremeum HHB9708]
MNWYVSSRHIGQEACVDIPQFNHFEIRGSGSVSPLVRQHYIKECRREIDRFPATIDVSDLRPESWMPSLEVSQ